MSLKYEMSTTSLDESWGTEAFGMRDIDRLHQLKVKAETLLNRIDDSDFQIKPDDEDYYQYQIVHRLVYLVEAAWLESSRLRIGSSDRIDFGNPSMEPRKHQEERNILPHTQHDC